MNMNSGTPVRRPCARASWAAMEKRTRRNDMHASRTIWRRLERRAASSSALRSVRISIRQKETHPPLVDGDRGGVMAQYGGVSWSDLRPPGFEFARLQSQYLRRFRAADLRIGEHLL